MATRHKAKLRAFRIADARYPLFDGSGALQHGGRWNSPGRAVIYASLTYAGALLEILAHTGRAGVPATQRCIEIVSRRPVGIEEISPVELPGWDAADLRVSRDLGDGWLVGARSVALIVPSIVAAPHERNVVLNPLHPEFRLLRAGPPRRVRWDERLFGA
jgi:RES domain-containing protein